MKKLSQVLLANLVVSQRKASSITQQQLADLTGINRTILSHLEQQEYIPSIPQLEKLAEVLNFEPDAVFVESVANTPLEKCSPFNIAVAGTGYVGLSIAILLA